MKSWGEIYRKHRYLHRDWDHAVAMTAADEYINRKQREAHRAAVTPNPDGGYDASVPALKGCMAWGKTEAEALETLADVKAAWLEAAAARETDS